MSLRKRSLALHGCVVLYGSLFSAMLHADSTNRYEFDNAILMGNATLNDLQSFNAAGLLPGKYIVDIYINDSWRGRRELLFKKIITAIWLVAIQKHFLKVWELTLKK